MTGARRILPEPFLRTNPSTTGPARRTGDAARDQTRDHSAGKRRLQIPNRTQRRPWSLTARYRKVGH